MDKALKIISLVAKIFSIIGGLTAYAGMIPEKWGHIAILVFGIASVLHHTVVQIGDLIDDGKDNDSFKG